MYAYHWIKYLIIYYTLKPFSEFAYISTIHTTQHKQAGCITTARSSGGWKHKTVQHNTKFLCVCGYISRHNRRIDVWAWRKFWWSSFHQNNLPSVQHICSRFSSISFCFVHSPRINEFKKRKVRTNNVQQHRTTTNNDIAQHNNSPYPPPAWAILREDDGEVRGEPIDMISFKAAMLNWQDVRHLPWIPAGWWPTGWEQHSQVREKNPEDCLGWAPHSQHLPFVFPLHKYSVLMILVTAAVYMNRGTNCNKQASPESKKASKKSSQ
jgi:hypothetical protein